MEDLILEIINKNDIIYISNDNKIVLLNYNNAILFVLNQYYKNE